MPKATARAQLRNLIVSGRSMADAEDWYRRGIISPAAFDRFERLWIWSTATEHARTRHVPLACWSPRRERIRRAVSKLREA